MTDENLADRKLIGVIALEVAQNTNDPTVKLRIVGVNQEFQFLLSPPAAARLSQQLNEAVQGYLYGENER